MQYARTEARQMTGILMGRGGGEARLPMNVADAKFDIRQVGLKA